MLPINKLQSAIFIFSFLFGITLNYCPISLISLVSHLYSSIISNPYYLYI